LSAEVVTRDIYVNAVAWRSSTWQLAAVIGPALGGLVYGFAGAAVAYAGVTVLMALALVALWLVSHNARPEVQDAIPIGESLRLGIRFIWNQPILLAAM